MEDDDRTDGQVDGFEADGYLLELAKIGTLQKLCPSSHSPLPTMSLLSTRWIVGCWPWISELLRTATTVFGRAGVVVMVLEGWG